METKTATFKMFASFQYYENCGTEAAPYWKPKFGDVVLVMDGITADMLCHKNDLMDAVPSALIDAHCWSNSGSEQYFVGFYFAESGKATEQEIIDAYAMGIDLEDEDDEIEESVFIDDKYELIAECLGY